MTEVELKILATVVHEGVAVVLLLAAAVARHVLAAVILGSQLIVREDLGWCVKPKSENGRQHEN